jgi:hypothetical protein
VKGRGLERSRERGGSKLSQPDEPIARLTVKAWLALLRQHLGSDADLELSADERRVVLELAALAAHASERVAAPLSTFIVGLAFGSTRGARRAEMVAALTRALRERLASGPASDRT